ncbi:MAG: radical SAM protein, partial [Bacteroidales bacterium]|nr:radical SAM protein [Bacteroidales bacterium]
MKQRSISSKEKNIAEQIGGHLIFSPLVSFFDDQDNRFLDNLADSNATEITIADLKKKLRYDEVLDRQFYQEQDVTAISNIIRDNPKISLITPWVIKVNKKNIKKLMRIDKYYNASTYLFEKFPSAIILKQEKFFLPFLYTTLLFAMLRVLPNAQRISVVFLENLDEFISMKSMLAINKKIKENPKIQPNSATLIMSEECNLRCNYCYEPRKTRNKAVLSFEMAKAVLRKFDRDTKVTFFGGEPMLRIDLMKKICELGWEFRNFTFEMVTN